MCENFKFLVYNIQNLQNFENFKFLCLAQKWLKLFEIFYDVKLGVETTHQFCVFSFSFF